ncbi:hypothetical protein [Cognatiyoonia sp. IB215182]|uniref:hypothetical protein n=1 Tax=Cognatiyoonia sp. IB215182 TaxID=3097353 RepID=UPI002A0EC654|nr:hypothetical protein [Cognatiyoonia sp. IB215182]MDX8355834.1 hypothetical protein [Cognatiyoonia sp. IB215182]
MKALRPPEQVMCLERLGAAHQTRISFMRALLRGLRRGGWQVDRPLWQIDADGVGRAVYRVRGQGQCYSLVAFSHDLPDELRSDRVIAEAWDATFALVDGDVDAHDLERLAANVPLQEAGRVSDSELVLSRANRSARLWDHVVARLAQGAQPDATRIEDVGYLMRTTAVYGSGKFGAADYATFAGRPLMDGPFRAEMLTVWLIRAFVLDLVEHVAKAQGGAAAARLDPALRRRLGIGNSTGLGMAPFLVNHPALLNAWIFARETALARVRGLSASDVGSRAAFSEALERTRALVASWHSDQPVQIAKLTELRGDIRRLADVVSAGALEQVEPWDALWHWAQTALSVEGQELVVSLMLEPHGELVDDLSNTMGADEIAAFRIDGTIPVLRLARILKANYGWALETDYEAPSTCARFWYVSEAKLEPRLGERHEEPGGELEQPLDIARAAALLARDVSREAMNRTVADFLRDHPHHRRIVRRVQFSVAAPYAEIRDNLIDAEIMPIDMLRAKLAFFGATRFDPRSDRWVRITMYQNAPFPHELHDLPEDDWVLPVRSEVVV